VVWGFQKHRDQEKRRQEMSRITMTELRELRYCASGAKAWCERYGFDFRELVRDGLDADAVAATGDYLGVQAAALAMQKDADGR
jgi:hypothetical protein